MINAIITVLSPVFEVAVVIAFLAVIAAPIYYFSTKTQIGARVMSWIGMSAAAPETEEDPYNGFRIHSRNFTSV